MIWEYQTIIFDFTKDGLLGDKYVDEQEMQKTLNELGETGWELVNALLLQDGVLAFLKRQNEGDPPQDQAYMASFHDQGEEPRMEDFLATRPDSAAQVKERNTRTLGEMSGPDGSPILSPPFSIEPRYNQGNSRETGHGKRHRDNDDSDIFGGIRIA